jgi:hypothetical protein
VSDYSEKCVMNDAIQKIQFQTRSEKNKQTDSGKYHYVDVD